MIEGWVHAVDVIRDVTVFTQYQTSLIVPLSATFTNSAVQATPTFPQYYLCHLWVINKFYITKLHYMKPSDLIYLGYKESNKSAAYI